MQQQGCCSCIGTAYLDLRLAKCGLSWADRGWVGFLRQTIFEPGEPQCAMPAAFLLRVHAISHHR
jgi:hypothetical protein